jgi:RNA recognition motif-containing protein
MELFVANFGKKTTEDELKELFSDHGLVNDVTIVVDWETGESKGYAFVSMPDYREAEKAIARLDGSFWNGRRLKVNQKRKRSKS